MEYDFLNSDGGLYAVEVTSYACVGCETMAHSVNSVIKEFPKYKFIRLDEGKDNEIIKKLNVEKVPCLILFKNGKEFARVCGYQPEEILQLWIEHNTKSVLNQTD